VEGGREPCCCCCCCWWCWLSSEEVSCACVCGGKVEDGWGVWGGLGVPSVVVVVVSAMSSSDTPDMLRADVVMSCSTNECMCMCVCVCVCVCVWVCGCRCGCVFGGAYTNSVQCTNECVHTRTWHMHSVCVCCVSVCVFVFVCECSFLALRLACVIQVAPNPFCSRLFI